VHNPQDAAPNADAAWRTARRRQATLVMAMLDGSAKVGACGAGMFRFCACKTGRAKGECPASIMARLICGAVHSGQVDRRRTEHAPADIMNRTRHLVSDSLARTAYDDSIAHSIVNDATHLWLGCHVCSIHWFHLHETTSMPNHFVQAALQLLIPFRSGRRLMRIPHSRRHLPQRPTRMFCGFAADPVGRTFTQR
jgi:hypothetical protein